MHPIRTTDTPLLAAVASLGLENKAMLDDFVRDASHLLAYSPVAKCKIMSGHSNSDNIAHVPEAEVSTISTALAKASKSENDVEIRHCK